MSKGSGHSLSRIDVSTLTARCRECKAIVAIVVYGRHKGNPTYRCASLPYTPRHVLTNVNSANRFEKTADCSICGSRVHIQSRKARSGVKIVSAEQYICASSKKPMRYLHRLSNIDLTKHTADCFTCGIGIRVIGVKSPKCVYSNSAAKKSLYKTLKKDHCENCQFIPLDVCQLDVDHIDGNHDNNCPSNLWTLCANCHRLKGIRPELFWDFP